MRTLVIETATAACSVALLEGGIVLGAIHEVVGRGHAERLVPMIAELPGGGRADAILVDCGPGSFTGIRVGVAAARALAFGWEINAHGYTSLSLLAATALFEAPERGCVVAAVTGGHGEVFVQRFTGGPLTAVTDLVSLDPVAAALLAGTHHLIGTGAPAVLAARGDGDRGGGGDDRLPVATDVRHLPAAFTILPPQPVYGRPPDAKLPA